MRLREPTLPSMGHHKKTAMLAFVTIVLLAVSGVSRLPVHPLVSSGSTGSIIATPTATNAIASNPDRKLLNYGGYWWAFWTDTNGIYYSSSADGVTWSAPSLIGSTSLSLGSQFSVWLAGGVVYYVISSGGVSNSFTVGEGDLYGTGSSSPGTISILPETIVATTYTTGSYASIATDSQGNVWVAVPTSQNAPNEYVEVWELCNTCLSPSWQQVEMISGPAWISQPGAEVSLLQLNSGVGLVYSFQPEGTPGPLDIQTIVGGVASSPAIVQENFNSFSSTSIGNSIYIGGSYAGLANGLYETNVTFFSFNSGLTSPLTNFTSTSSFPQTSISEANGNTVVLFYSEFTNLYYVTSTDGGATWSSPQTLVAVVTTLVDLNAEYSTATSSVGVLYLDYEGGISAYLDFAQIGAGPTTIISPLSDTVSFSDAASYSVGQLITRGLSDGVTFSDTLSKSIGQLVQMGLSDSVSFSDQLSRSITGMIQKSLSDSISFSDQVSNSLGHLIQKGLSDTLSFVDSLSSNLFSISFNGNLVVQAHSPVDILVTDPHGNEVGCTSGGTVVDQISGATFSGCGTEPETITITNPIAGNYEIQIFGNSQASAAGSPFTVTITTTDPSGNPVDGRTITGIATPTFTQTLRYDILSDGMIAASSILPGVPEFPGSLFIVVLAILLVSLNYVRRRTGIEQHSSRA